MYRRTSIFLFVLFLSMVGLVTATSVPAPILPVEKAEKLPWGTKIYGSSTLDPSGQTSFSGRFLGVLHGVIGPGHDWYVVELEGDYFENSGIIHGQSGTPMYVKLDGKEYVLGTISYGDNFTKNPIAYLTPMGEVVNSEYPVANGAFEINDDFLQQLLPAADAKLFSSLGSFSAGKSTPGVASKEVKAGDVLGVQLAWGDFDYTGFGTVSRVDGDKIFMFGHPFLQLGPAEYRLVPAKVLAVQASTMSSYMIAAPIDGAPAIGSILQDRETGIFGLLGQEPKHSIPVTIHLHTSKGQTKEFHFNTVADPNIAGQLVGIGLYASVASWSRAMGDATFFMKGKIDVDTFGSISINQAFSNPEGLFFEIAPDVGQFLNNEYAKTTITNIDLDVKVFDEKRRLKIDMAALDAPVLKPGEEAHLMIKLSQPQKDPKTIIVPIKMPADLEAGMGTIIVGNALTINELENQNNSVVNLATLVESLKQNRKSDAVYIYIIYPPSHVDPAAGAGDSVTIKGIKMTKSSKRLFSNVDEYCIDLDDYIIMGSSVVGFKVGLK